MTPIVQKVLQEVRSGLISSVAAEAALFPLDTVKLRQQINGGSATQVFRRILKEQGATGLYQGLAGRLIQTITSNVGFFIWQTVFVQVALARKQGNGNKRQLGGAVSLILNMLAQQFNRLLTTPVDVVANVNQADPTSKGFFHTFAKLLREGGPSTLWRGLWVSLLLSLNPALMFTLVGKLSAFVSSVRCSSGPLGAQDIFWISGVSKSIATLLTYPLIRAKAVMQTFGSTKGLWATLALIAKDDGAGGLYSGVWLLSYKTVLFNSLMMALKQKVAAVLEGPKIHRRESFRRWSSWVWEGEWRQRLELTNGSEKPWTVASKRSTVVYVDGSWSFLHPAQKHMLQEAAARGDHLIVGVHTDECHHLAVGTWPSECYAARLARLRKHPRISSILLEAPWVVTEELVRQLGITKVLSGSFTKQSDCTSLSVLVAFGEFYDPSKRKTGASEEGEDKEDQAVVENGSNEVERSMKEATLLDPYATCKDLGVFEEVPSLNTVSEYDVWVHKVARLLSPDADPVQTVSRVLFSNVDASIDWRILVDDGDRWGRNPGY